MSKFIKSVGRRFVYFGRNSSIQGLRFIFSECGNLLSRCFWCAVILFSSGCLYGLLYPVIGLGSEVGFTLDSRYLHWTSIFPAVTICETYDPKFVQKQITKNYQQLIYVADLMNPLSFDFKRHLSDVVYGRGTCSKSVCVPCGGEVPCDLNWRTVINDIHRPCVEMLADCSYNGVAIACCEFFRIVDSEYGACFSFNSLQNAESKLEEFAVVNRSTGPGVLSFRLLYSAQISVHSTEELSTNYLDTKFKFFVKPVYENVVDYFFSVIEVENDPHLQKESIEVRRCRYSHEVPKEILHTYAAYSYGACRLARSTLHSYEHCKCIHPVRDITYQDKYCNYTGINCIITYNTKAKLGIDKHEDDDEDCFPSCIESELKTVHLSRRLIPELQREHDIGTIVNIKMMTLPNLRYGRNLLRSNLDLVVSIGGMVGLFFSASVLSLVEVFYLVMRRPA